MTILVYSADTEKANLLNDYFTAQTFLDKNNGSFPQTIPIPNYRLDSLTLLPTEVEEILKSLPLGKAAGPDSINNRVLKELAQPLSIPLCNLFNFSLTTDKVSKIWKQANVSPIYKKNDPSDVSNYMPISLLSTVASLLGTVIHFYHDQVFRNILCLLWGRA